VRIATPHDALKKVAITPPQSGGLHLEGQGIICADRNVGLWTFMICLNLRQQKIMILSL
jgi:hypothetical protein